MVALLLTYVNWMILQHFGVWSFVGLSIMVNVTVWIMLILLFYSDYLRKDRLISLKNAILHKDDG